MNDAPIGVFDSGLGGLTVTRAIIDQLPGEDVVYLGDSLNTPYGSRPLDEVAEFTIAGLDRLVELGAKVLVIACNTATAAALHEARARYEAQGIPVIEVVSPAARAAAATTRNHRIGVLGTEATIGSGIYAEALDALADVTVTQSAAPAFVGFVERGETTGPGVTRVAREYLRPLVEAGVDTIILGCTHYPLLTGVLARELGPGVRLVTSSQATANATYAELVDQGLLHSARPLGQASAHRFYSTDPRPQFSVLAQRFLGPEVRDVRALSLRDSTHGKEAP